MGSDPNTLLSIIMLVVLILVLADCRDEHTRITDRIGVAYENGNVLNFSTCTPAEVGLKSEAVWRTPAEIASIFSHFPRILFVGDSVVRRCASILDHYASGHSVDTWEDTATHQPTIHGIGTATVVRAWAPWTSQVLEKLKSGESWDAIVVGSPDHEMALNKAELYTDQLSDLCRALHNHALRGTTVLLSGVFLAGQHKPYRGPGADANTSGIVKKANRVMFTKLMAHHYGIWYLDEWNWVYNNPGQCLDARDYRGSHIHFHNNNATLAQAQIIVNTLYATLGLPGCFAASHDHGIVVE